MSNQRVYKLTFPPGAAEMSAHLPVGAEVVHFGSQGLDLCFWYIDTDLTAGKEERHFSVRGTGHDIEFSAAYIDTTQVGSFVFHLFETTGIKEND